MIHILENTDDFCFECWDNTGKAQFYYEKNGGSSIIFKRTVVLDRFEESDSFRLTIGMLIEIAMAMKLTIVAECPWIASYLKTYGATG